MRFLFALMTFALFSCREDVANQSTLNAAAHDHGIYLAVNDIQSPFSHHDGWVNIKVWTPFEIEVGASVLSENWEYLGGARIKVHAGESYPTLKFSSRLPSHGKYYLKLDAMNPGGTWHGAYKEVIQEYRVKPKHHGIEIDYHDVPDPFVDRWGWANVRVKTDRPIEVAISVFGEGWRYLGGDVQYVHDGEQYPTLKFAADIPASGEYQVKLEARPPGGGAAYLELMRPFYFSKFGEDGVEAPTEGAQKNPDPPKGSEKEVLLKVTGVQLTDGQGTPVQIVGPSFHHLMNFTYHIENMVYLKRIGANMVRLPYYYGHEGGLDHQAYMDRFFQLADAALSQDLYLIADFHAIGDPASSQIRQSARRFFNDVLHRYGDHQKVIYEIFNEPLAERDNGSLWRDIKSYAHEFIPLIRNVAPNSIIIVGTPRWSSDLKSPAQDPLSYDNILYGFHFYSSGHVFDESLWDLSEQIPIFASEWAPFQPIGYDRTIDFTELYKYTDWLKVRKISWGNWSISDEDMAYAMLNKSANQDGQIGESELTLWGRMFRDLMDDKELNKSFQW